MGQLRDLAKRQLHANDLKISALLKENATLKAKVAELTAHNTGSPTIEEVEMHVSGDLMLPLLNNSERNIITSVYQFICGRHARALGASIHHNNARAKLADLLSDALELCHDGEFELGYKTINEVIGQLRAVVT